MNIGDRQTHHIAARFLSIATNGTFVRDQRFIAAPRGERRPPVDISISAGGGRFSFPSAIRSLQWSSMAMRAASVRLLP